MIEAFKAASKLEVDSGNISRVQEKDVSHMAIVFSLLTFVVAVVCLVVAAKFFTKSAEEIGYRLGMSPFAIGIVIVSIGTSLPELVAGVAAVRAGDSEIVPGNIIGSSLSNILLVLGLTVVLSPKSIDLGPQYIYIDLNFLLGAGMIAIVTMYDGNIRFGEAMFGCMAYAIYILYLLKSGNSNPDKQANEQPSVALGSWIKTFLILAASSVAIYFSADKTIESLSQVASILGVGKAIISMTLLSLGTTLPECVVSVTAARLGNAGMAIGNVLGSCIFNALAIPGVAVCFGSLVVPDELISFSLPVYAGVVLLFYVVTQDKKISAYEGALLLLLYGLFMGKICRVI